MKRHGWNGQVHFIEKRLLDPLRWKAPRRIFVNSMSDLFHENVTDKMRDRIFAVMALCPQHTFQVLTKRPDRMLKYFTAKHLNPQKWPAEEYDVQTCIRLSMGGLLKGKTLSNGCPDVLHFFKSGQADRYGEADRRVFNEWPLPNVWLGVSVENQATADERIPLLLQTPAAVRFISAEPLLGPLNILPFVSHPASLAGSHIARAVYLESGEHALLDWVICGGESGTDARPMRSSWAQGIRDRCKAAGVPFFFKQWGEYLGEMQDGPSGAEELILNSSDEPVRVGKKKAGSLLDGIAWKQFPTVMT
jgi:protein gp37